MFGFVYFCITVCPFKVCNHLEEEEKASCCAIIVLQMYCYYKCSVALPRGVMGWSAVCDCGIYFLIILTYFLTQLWENRDNDEGILSNTDKIRFTYYYI